MKKVTNYVIIFAKNTDIYKKKQGLSKLPIHLHLIDLITITLF